MSHGRTVCTHGALVSQCRCMDHGKTTTVVACPWPEAHGDYPTIPATLVTAPAHPDRQGAREELAAVREDVARAIWTDGLPPAIRKPWADLMEDTRNAYRRMADAALSATTPVVERLCNQRAAEALEGCAAWMESLASPTLNGDPFIRAADWAAGRVRDRAHENGAGRG